MTTAHRTDGHRRGDEHSVGELVARATTQMSQLLHEELRLAKMEMTEKGKRAGLGGGMLGAAATIAFIAVQAGVAAAIAGLAVVWPVWLSALVVMVVLLLVAGVLAVLGRQEVRRATPAKPERALRGVQDDFHEIRGRVRR
ncbi:phage holin family protein [Streptomyces sp. TRM43335]|uniref:Phage holin family protein n=1 Tax=Streptomyces taklimakanensis TaxID=2569853 RepID=A0A6G2BC81_9ACTN|nr:phage holin family protein [Streptomyces taklimakanensis]MTE19512.1 phage holin family protein [Streptomyces taklimakanensis]